MIWTIAGDIIGGVGLIIMIFLYFKQTKDGEKALKIQKEEYEEQLKKRAETLQEGQKNLLQEIEAIKQAVFAWRTSDQPISQEQVKSFSGKVDAVAATAAALWVSVADVVKFSEEVAGNMVYPYEQFPNGKKPKQSRGVGRYPVI